MPYDVAVLIPHILLLFVDTYGKKSILRYGNNFLLDGFSYPWFTVGHDWDLTHSLDLTSII